MYAVAARLAACSVGIGGSALCNSVAAESISRCILQCAQRQGVVCEYEKALGARHEPWAVLVW